MRSITVKEAVAIRALLAALPISERERVTETGLESRTFERIRRRAYSDGWLFDRFVPAPLSTGFGAVIFVVAHPFAEFLSETQTLWKGLPSNVLLWRWPETLFGVFFTKESPQRFLARIQVPNSHGEVFVVASDSSIPSVPVYFDYEAAWSRHTHQAGTLAYPHALSAPPPREGVSPNLRVAELAGVAGLVGRPFRNDAERGRLHMSPFFFPRSFQRLLKTRAVELRTILDPQALPPYEGSPIERIAFVQGELNSPGTERQLFRLLMALQVTPFLFASDGSRVLLATLSPAPVDTPAGANRPAVLRSLRSLLKEIRIVRESVQSLTVVVNHRYDRLFPFPP
jgi:hypothetical protein